MMSSRSHYYIDIPFNGCWCPLSKDDGHQISYDAAKAFGATQNKQLERYYHLPSMLQTLTRVFSR